MGAPPKLVPEDILEEYPTPSPFEEVDPPKWALKAVTQNTGHHTPKWERFEYRYGGWQNPLSYLTGESSYDTTSTSKRSKKLKKRAVREQRKAVKDLIPKGNIKNEDYRFWRGAATEANPESTCRWCYGASYSDAARKDHHRTVHCNAKLMVVYKLAKAADKPKCFVCGKQTFCDHWGVPLCNDAGCMSRWKFQPLSYMDEFIDLKRQALFAGYLDGFKDESERVKVLKNAPVPKR